MTKPTRQARPHRPHGRSARRAAALALALALGPNFGCGREFFREWADQDVTEAVFEKTRDPRWRLDLFTIEPPALARFADPYDPDRPPAPPDDKAAQALAPVPQWPHFRLLTPAEGTGYLDMMEKWGRLDPRADGPAPDQVTAPATPVPAPPGDGGPSPFRPSPLPPVMPNPTPELGNPGANPAGMSPIPSGPSSPRTPPPSSDIDPGPGVNPPQARSHPPKPRDTSVQLAAFQAADPAPNQPGAATPTVPAGGPAPRGAAPATGATLGQPGPGVLVPRPDIDAGDVPVDLNPRAIERRPGGPLPPAEEERVEAATAGFAAALQPGALEFDEAAAAGLPPEARPYIVNPAQAMTLGLMNSRAYQYRIEQIYITSLAVTLNRFNFTPQFFAGASPSTAVPQFNAGGVAGGATPGGGNLALVSPATSFLYRTKETGSPTSTLSLGTAAGAGKLFMFGGRLATNFANQTVFNFLGTNPRQPTVQSFFPISFVQPFLSGGGRAVTLESLTLAERNLVYEVRNFARFRQTFLQYLLGTAGVPNFTLYNPAGFGTDPVVGYLQVIQQLQQVENDRRNVSAFEQILKVYTELAKGPASGLSQLQVDQVEQTLQQTRQQLVQDETQYRNLLDQYKIQLGMPPDTPMVLDRSITHGFRDVFTEIDEWSALPERDPEQLIPIIARLPKLDDVEVYGHSVLSILTKQEEIAAKEQAIIAREAELRDVLKVDPARPAPTDPPAAAPIRREVEARRREVLGLKEQLSQMPNELFLASQRAALENRLDLMNQRAQLYDMWRQLTVTANGLLGIFNVGVTNQFITPPATTNPFAFVDQNQQWSLVLNAELPLVRVAQRNNFRTAQINYRRAQRLLQSTEDGIKFSVRQEARQLLLYAQLYEIGKRNLFLNLRQKDNTLRQILAPPTQADISNPANAATNQATQTLNLIRAQQNILGSLNTLIQQWVQYQTERLVFYADTGIMPYDEWEAYYEFFPAVTADSGRGAGGNADASPRPAGP